MRRSIELFVYFAKVSEKYRKSVKSVKSVVKLYFSKAVKSLFITGLVLFSIQTGYAQVKTGADQTHLYFPHLKNKSIAVVANAASVINRINVVDTLVASGFEVTKVFCPEHGFRSFVGAGQTVKNSVDSATGVPVISLYGKKKRPEKSDFEDVDLILFDLQDVGVRFFTYISTLTYVMEACAENNTPLLVLDRPNPNGFYIDGPVLDSTQRSFVGLHPVPVIYGMTIGEYARMVNEEGWLKNGVICELSVIPLGNYTHSAHYELPVRPSPNLPNMNAVYLYPSLCLFEGTVMSVGRGTDFPFEVFGHPAMKGFSFSFQPRKIKDYNDNPLFKDQDCRGLDLRDFYSTHPKMKGRLNLAWLMMAYKDLGSKPDFFNDYFGKLAGNSELQKQIMEDLPESEIRKTWSEGITKFKQIRSKYLLYPE
jgi:uncharacterized protein YbbC (DUF1343 family)